MSQPPFPGTPDPYQQPQYGGQPPQYGQQPPYGGQPQYGGQPPGFGGPPPASSGPNTALIVVLVVLVMTVIFALIFFLFLRDSDGGSATVVTDPSTTTTIAADATTVPEASVTPTTVAEATTTLAPTTTVAPAPATTAAPAPATTAAPAPATTAPPAPAPAPAGSLDPGLGANFGTTSITPGFVPDPDQTFVTSGGSVDVSYLGGACVGFASAAPDLKVNYAGGGGFLRISFTPNVTGDTALVINDANGNWLCNDDFFGLDPAIEFTNPNGGLYDVWIASFVEGEFVDGTVSITEIP